MFKDKNQFVFLFLPLWNLEELITLKRDPRPNDQMIPLRVSPAFDLSSFLYPIPIPLIS